MASERHATTDELYPDTLRFSDPRPVIALHAARDYSLFGELPELQDNPLGAPAPLTDEEMDAMWAEHGFTTERGVA